MSGGLKKLLSRLRRRADVSKGESAARLRGAPHSTGETVFGATPLRLRSLTLPGARDLPGFDAASLAGGFKIRVAKLQGRKTDAATLVQHRYSNVGYHIPPVIHQDPNLCTFIAYDEGALVGTVALRLDSERGLSADELYKKEIDMLRQAGSRLCEFTRLAADKSAASKPVLAGLFHVAYLYANVLRHCTHAVIEVTPEHARFYHRALSFERIGDEQLNPRVNTVGVLMCVAFEDIAAGLAKYAGKPDEPGALRSLFVYGFPPNEEAGVLGRLRELGQGS